MLQRIYLILIVMLMSGCSSAAEHSLIQINREVEVGPYVVSPPKGYWYFPREYSNNFKNSEDIFLLTFWENKEGVLKKDPTLAGIFFNLGIAENKYNNFDEYYNEARKWNIKYDKLPEKASLLLTLKNWSCKQNVTSVYGIECIALGNNLITIGGFGSEKDLVLNKISLFKNMIESFSIKEK